MGRQPCCEKVGLKRGPWTIEEDSKLVDFILNNGIKCWRLVPKLAGLMRCGKSCRLRWINYLRPDLKRGAFTEAEEDMIIQLHARLGNRWSKIAAHFPGRTDNEIKNHWNTRIKKKLKQLGLDPITQTPLVHDHHKIKKPTNNDKQLVNQENPNLTNQDHKDHCQLISGSNDHQDNIISIDDQSCRNTTLEMEMEMGSSSSLMLQNYIDFSMDSSWMDDNPFLWDDFTYSENSFA